MFFGPDAVRDALPADYGDVELGGPVDEARSVGVVVPVFGRPAVVRQSLASLAASDLSDCAICLVDETLAAPPPASIGPFERLENVNSAGEQLERLALSRPALMARAAGDPRCVAFNDSGALLAGLADEPTPMGNTRFSLYVRRSYLAARPALAARYRAAPAYRVEPEARAHVSAFAPPGVPVIRVAKRRHGHMFDSLRAGLDLFASRCEALMILDADTLHHPDWVARSRAVHQRLSRRAKGAPILVSGFHTRGHRTLRAYRRYRLKRTVGGIHLVFDPATYRQIIRPTLRTLSWDFDACAAIEAAGGRVACTRPSVIQHIGAWGLWSRPGRWMDRAEDFDG